MKLIRLEGYNLTIEPELLTIKVFKKIWTRDKTAKKEKAIQELGYIYFMEDPRSDYQYIIDREARSAAIKEGEGMSPSWEPDQIVLDAMKYFATFKPTSALVLEDLRYMAEKLRKEARSVEFSEIDDEAKKIQAMNSLTGVIKQMASLVVTIDAAEKTLTKELMQSDKVRGSQEKSTYEDLDI